MAYSRGKLMPDEADNEQAEKRNNARQQILDYLLAHLGMVIDGAELRTASGNISEWARRVRELRSEFGYQVLTDKDRHDLKPGQYLLETIERLPVNPRNISKETRAFVLVRDGHTGQMCGLVAGDPDPFDPSRVVRLTLGHIVEKSKGGADTPDNLRAVCNNCNEGLQNAAPPLPDRIHLLAQIRRATIDDQRAIMAWLKQKFGEDKV